MELAAAEARGAGKAVSLELFADPALPAAVGDPDTVYRVLVNLVKNALDAVADGGTVRIEARVAVGMRVRRGGRRGRNTLELAVADDGAGMTGEQAEKAFLPFYTTKPKGTGLGLVMARQAVARQGGTLEIRSAPGRGTTVTISLPAAP
jgi:two-component system nitrogen regulation sensor histidine kinase GlnL